jgi:very-short-patch-repair endonuclease
MVINGHLTELKLGELLTHLYGENNVKAQYKLEKYKIDFYVEPINTYFEFDGFRHFTCHSTIVRDNLVGKIIEKQGAKLVRVPYFIQANTVLTMLSRDDTIVQDYKDGFISPKALKPRDFSRYGHVVFLKIFESLPSFSKEQILETLGPSDL